MNYILVYMCLGLLSAMCLQPWKRVLQIHMLAVATPTMRGATRYITAGCLCYMLLVLTALHVLVWPAENLRRWY